MDKLIERSELRDLHEKVAGGTRLDETDCRRLFESHDLAAIGVMADLVRARQNGPRAYYIINRHLNYSNLCVLDCAFCSFYRRRRDPGAYEHTIEELVAKAREALQWGITELHIVGGLHPSFKWEYYTGLLRALQALDPRLHLKAFTAIEIRHLSWVGKRSVRDTLAALREAGLGSLTGGGAEIFDPEVRRVICHAKESAEEWLAVHRTWHQLGGRSTCTMLIGHVEQVPHRVAHLQQLRALQDETGGFTAFVPLAFHPANNQLAHLPGPTGADLLKTLAIARLYLDNVPHIKAYWILMGLKLAQVSLSFGVDDLDGTVIEEKIYHMAGARTPQQLTRDQLITAIREAGREPVQRDSLYQAVGETSRPGPGESTDRQDACPTGSGETPDRPGAGNEGGLA
ncbi:aminofutalosine synthase MqnE [bacterium]|nr:aminofutalosine synthase MqnE [bacterium]